MPTIKLNQSEPRHDADWVGENAAFTCPHCSKVFIVTSAFQDDETVTKLCPCGKSLASIRNTTDAWLDY